MKKLVFVSTPFHADTGAEMLGNIKLAQRICKQVLEDGGIPYAPHLLFPQFLDDADACQRAAGIEAGIEMLRRCDILVFSGGKVTDGMTQEMKAASDLGIPVVYLKDPEEPESKGKKEEKDMHNEEILALLALMESLDSLTDVAVAMGETNCRFGDTLHDAVLKLMTAATLLSHSDSVRKDVGEKEEETDDTAHEKLAEKIAAETGYDEDVISDILSSAYDFLQKHYEKEDGNGKDE